MRRDLNTQRYWDIAHDVWWDDLTDVKIAEKHGISRRTLARLKKTPQFVEMLGQIQENYASEARHMAIREARRVVQTLFEMLDDDTVSDETKRRCCNDLIELAGLKQLQEPKDARQTFVDAVKRAK